MPHSCNTAATNRPASPLRWTHLLLRRRQLALHLVLEGGAPSHFLLQLALVAGWEM